MSVGRGKGGKGLGKGGAKRFRKVLKGLHPGHHQASHQAPRAQGRREADLRPYLRGNPRRDQAVHRERRAQFATCRLPTKTI